MDELVKICQEARESCYARRCKNCKHNVKDFPQCQNHHYAEKLAENSERVIEALKGENT